MGKLSKKIRLNFKLNSNGEKTIWTFINDSLRQRKSQVKSSNKRSLAKEDSRQDVRIILDKQHSVKLFFFQTRESPAQEIRGVILDLSLGGACIKIGICDEVLPNSRGTIELNFLPQTLLVSFEVIGP